MIDIFDKIESYKPQPVIETSQDILILSQLMRVTRTPDFTEEELEYYQSYSEVFKGYPVVGPSLRGKILTPDFTEEELAELQWSSVENTRSCHGFCLTNDPTEEEIDGWQNSLEWLNNLDFDAAKKRMTILKFDE